MHNQRSNIILTGFMGTGKTTVGNLLAKALAFDFVDTDAEIEKRSGRSIPDIFAQSGEATFRQLEHDVAVELASLERQVIATGGGLVTNQANVEVLARTGRFFCLTASPEQILARVTADASRVARPLLQVENPAGRIQALLSQRSRQYGQFPQINTDGKKPHHIVRDILIAL